MPTTRRSEYALPADLYWQQRTREVVSTLALVKQAVDDANVHQAALKALWDTSKSRDPDWQEHRIAAQAAVRKARAQRTRLRRLVGHCRDTIRIRKNLAEALPQKMADLLDESQQMIEYLESHGY